MVTIEGVNPTRMELLRLKSRAKLAEKGHRLLREKRDALIAEFFDILDEARGIRRRAEDSLMSAFRSLTLAQATLGTERVSGSAISVKSEIDLTVDSRSIMGILVPVLEASSPKRHILERGYGMIDTSHQLDDAASRFEDALAVIVQLAEMEKSLQALGEEITKTKRRVNALEYIVLPRLTATVKYIEMRLDEMERENFFKLKRIKAMMEESEALLEEGA